MSGWRLLEETTLESAKEWGAVWLRDDHSCTHMLHLPHYVVERLGCIPNAHVAQIIIDRMTLQGR